MAKQHDQKTNAMRVLDAANIAYHARIFDCPEALSGVEVAKLLDLNPDQMFKTLVTQGKSGEHYVFMIPVAEALDLKKAAGVVGEKAISMIKSKDLLGLTGYIHGGCSPIGMKKPLVTTIDETAELFDSIIFSAGRIGAQIEVPLEGLSRVIEYTTADVVV